MTLLSPILYSFRLQYLPADKVPDREATTKQVAPRLIDRQLGKKVTIMLGDIGDAPTRWMVDVLSGSADTDYNKLD